VRGRELLVERETDGLDRNVCGTGLLEEGSEDSGWDVTTTANGDHELRLEVLEDTHGSLLTELVHLEKLSVIVFLFYQLSSTVQQLSSMAEEEGSLEGELLQARVIIPGCK
jgi:hypothetical protein